MKQSIRHQLEIIILFLLAARTIWLLQYWSLYISLIISLFLGLVALLKEEITRALQKPELQIVQAVVDNQTDNDEKIRLKVIRLILKNEGNRLSENTQADLVKVIELSGDERKELITLPFNWMHNQLKKEGGINEKNIYPGQPAYLDVANLVIPRGAPPLLQLATLVGRDNPKWTLLRRGSTRIIIKIYEEGGYNKSFEYQIDWDGSENDPKVAALDSKQ